MRALHLDGLLLPLAITVIAGGVLLSNPTDAQTVYRRKYFLRRSQLHGSKSQKDRLWNQSGTTRPLLDGRATIPVAQTSTSV